MVLVKLFANFREIAGDREIEVDATSLGELLDLLFERYPGFQDLMEYAVIAVNGRLVERDETVALNDGDVVAIFPPVSGGTVLFDRLESLESAQRKMLRMIKQFRNDDIETLPVDGALGRITASDVRSEIDIPHYNRCAMDGFAVKSENVRKAGRTNPVLLKKGMDAIWVHTGDELPEGFDAVVKAEDTEEIGDSIAVYRAVRRHENVGLKGEDVKTGEVIAEKGRMLKPHDLALLTSAGITEVEVFRKPKIKVIPTGSELVRNGESLKPGKVFESNGLMISAYIEEWGGVSYKTDIIPDIREKIEDAFRDIDGYDMVVTTGGTSVGRRDLIFEVLDSLGEIVFRGVALRPGKPTIFAMVDQVPILSLPGFPSACVASAYLFLKPAIFRMLWRDDDVVLNVRVTENIYSKPGFTSFVRLNVDFQNMTAKPISSYGSGILSSVTQANAYTLVEDNVEVVEENEIVKAHLL